ncbi:MAG: glycosyltransferase [Anaerolineae bacterium]|nr:glycosyltransferase [Anaerolineae bacterium]
MHILFIIPYVPNLIRVRPYNLIRHLAARGHRITLATLCSSDDEQADLQTLRDQGIEVIAAPLPRLCSLANCLRALPTDVPLQAVYCWSPALARALNEAIGQQLNEAPGCGAPGTSPSPVASSPRRPVDIIHVEHLRGARYGLHVQSALHNPQPVVSEVEPSTIRIPQSALRNPQPVVSEVEPSAIPIVWDSVDCISYLFEQAARHSRSPFGKLITRLELARTRRYEAWLVHQFARVLVTSEVDRQALQDLASRFTLHVSRITHHATRLTPHASRITVLPNGVDLSYFTPADAPREPDTLIFSGKMSYHANVTAVLHLVNDIMPLVWAGRQHVRLIIAGKDPPRQVRALAARHWPLITVTGTVPDLRPYLRQATAAVVPSPYGAGIQNKVLEAMACATPVVASPQAVSALQTTDGQDVLLAAEPAEFARRLLHLLEDSELQQRIGRAGRAYVEKNHDWRVIAARLEEVYREVLS